MSLIAWLPLNGNTKNSGLSTFSISGSPVWVNGKLGKQALSLNSRLTFTIPEMVGAKTWSVAFWCVTFDDATLSSDWVDIMGMHDRKADDSATGDFRWETCYGSAKGVAIGQYNNGTYATMTTNGGTLQGTKGSWHHCVASTDFENGTVAIYLDGVLKYTKVHAGGWLLGDFWLGQTNLVNGAIQDVRIYNHALSVKEIKELSKGLIMHLPLDWGANPNLQPNSNTFGTTAGNPNNFTHETKVYDGHNAIRMTCKTNNYSGGPYRAGFAKGTLAIVGKKYTWSMYIRGSSAFTMNTVGHECGGTKQVSVTTEWQKVTHTWTVTDGAYTAWVFYGRTWALGDWIEVKDFKVEEGDKATPYVPNASEAIYSTYSFANKYLEDCSGYNNEIKAIGSNNTSCVSPKGLGGTTCGASSAINLGKACKIAAPFTLAFWFNTSDLTNNNNRLVSCTETGGWNIELNGNYLCWTTGTGASSNTYKYCISTKAYTELQGAWHHIACTYDGLKAQMYLDGVLNKETTHYSTATPIFYNNNNAVFLCAEAGNNATTPASTYATLTSVADFRFYATALSAADIKALYSIAAEIDKSGKVYCSNIVET